MQDREGPHNEPSATEGELLYTMEQWRAFDKKKEEGSSLSASKLRSVAGVHMAARRRRRDPGARSVLMAGLAPATTVAGLATWPRTAPFLHSTVGRLTSRKQRSRMPPCSWRTGASSCSKTQGRG